MEEEEAAVNSVPKDNNSKKKVKLDQLEEIQHLLEEHTEASFNIGLVPNNHLAYGVQWFLFAAVAAIIYAVAVLRRRAPVAGSRA